MLTQLEINIRDSEEQREREDTRLINAMHPFCYECGCIENGTIEYDDEVLNCHVCNRGEIEGM